MASGNPSFAADALAKILSNPEHPLKFLVDYTTRSWVGRSHLDDAPGIQVGHLTSKHSGAPERLALEDASYNQQSNWRGETQGAIFEKVAIEIGGVPVEMETARFYERDGLLPAGTTAVAPRSIGWSPAFGLLPDPQAPAAAPAAPGAAGSPTPKQQPDAGGPSTAPAGAAGPAGTAGLGTAAGAGGIVGMGLEVLGAVGGVVLGVAALAKALGPSEPDGASSQPAPRAPDDGHTYSPDAANQTDSEGHPTQIEPSIVPMSEAATIGFTPSEISALESNSSGDLPLLDFMSNDAGPLDSLGGGNDAIVSLSADIGELTAIAPADALDFTPAAADLMVVEGMTLPAFDGGEFTGLSDAAIVSVGDFTAAGVTDAFMPGFDDLAAHAGQFSDLGVSSDPIAIGGDTGLASFDPGSDAGLAHAIDSGLAHDGGLGIAHDGGLGGGLDHAGGFSDPGFDGGFSGGGYDSGSSGGGDY